MTSTSELAIFGGTPVWSGSWPAWPATGPQTLAHLQAVLDSGRWAISGQWTGAETWDRRFSRRFADYVGVEHCFTMDHGSSALVAALLALDIGVGQEVIVPALTWVACASAVMRVGATPVLVDISPDSLCIEPAAIEAAIGERTACIMVVHLYCCMTDMDRIAEIAERHRLPVIEDCAQAHGAEWRGRRAGSLGDIATFSMQQGKALTSGEGGAVVTRDRALADRLERLRCDGRRYQVRDRRIGRPDLEELPGLQGMNFCLSEFQAALLCDGLDRLDAQTERRCQHAALLDERFSEWPSLAIIQPYAGNTRRAYYHYAVRLTKDVTDHVPVARVCEALSAELGTWIHCAYPAIHRHPLYAPNTLNALPAVTVRANAALGHAEDQSARLVLLHHAVLLAERPAVEAIVEAFDKVLGHLDRLEACSGG